METENIQMKKILFNMLMCMALIFSVMSLYISLSLKEDVLRINNDTNTSMESYFVSAELFKSSMSDIGTRLSDLEVTTYSLNEKISQIDNSKVHLNTISLKEAENNDNVLKNIADSSVHTSYYTYNIKAGDTFSKIAKKNGVSLNSIIKANPNLNPQALKIGQEIIIPKK